MHQQRAQLGRKYGGGHCPTGLHRLSGPDPATCRACQSKVSDSSIKKGVLALAFEKDISAWMGPYVKASLTFSGGCCQTKSRGLVRYAAVEGLELDQAAQQIEHQRHRTERTRQGCLRTTCKPAAAHGIKLRACKEQITGVMRSSQSRRRHHLASSCITMLSLKRTQAVLEPGGTSTAHLIWHTQW